MKDDITVSELDIIVNIPAITAYICIQLVFTTAYSEGWKSLFNGMILILIKSLYVMLLLFGQLKEKEGGNEVQML